MDLGVFGVEGPLKALEDLWERRVFSVVGLKDSISILASFNFVDFEVGVSIRALEELRCITGFSGLGLEGSFSGLEHFLSLFLGVFGVDGLLWAREDLLVNFGSIFSSETSGFNLY